MDRKSTQSAINPMIIPYSSLKINNDKLGMRVWRWFLALSIDLTFNLFKEKMQPHLKY